MPDRRRDSLPLSSPFRISRNVPVSLPSRNATSGSISSDDTSELAFFAMRCESMASWLVKSTSRTLPPPAAACEEACWASSSSTVLPWLIPSSPLESDTRLPWLSRTEVAFFSTRSQRELTSASCPCNVSEPGTSTEAPLIVPPLVSASRSVRKRSRESLTASKAEALPCTASDVPRARRCESICISVAVLAPAAVLAVRVI